MSHPPASDPLAVFAARMEASLRRCDELTPRVAAVERERQHMREALRDLAASWEGDDA